MNELTILIGSYCHAAATFSSIGIPSPLHHIYLRLANCCATDHLCLLACRTRIFSLGRRIPLPHQNISLRIPSPCCHLSFRLVHPIAAPQYFLPAGASLRRAAIYPFGWCIPSQLNNIFIFIWPAHPFATLPSIHLAGASHCNDTIFSFGRHIPSLRRHLFFRPFDQRIPSQCCNVFFWWVWSITMWPL